MKNKKEIQERLNYMRFTLSNAQDKGFVRATITALMWVLDDGEDDKEKKIRELKQELEKLRGKK